MKNSKIRIAGMMLIVGCALSAFANEENPSTQKIIIKHPVGHFVEEGPAPFGIASYALYQSKIEESKGLEVIEKPIITCLLLRVLPRQLHIDKPQRVLLGALIVIIPGFFLGTLRKKNV
jgi:hypothetical protein